MDREKLLEDLMALDFAAVDLQLYLDTHPMDQEALESYNGVLEMAHPLRAEYEEKYGPLTSYRSYSDYPWQWIDEPWPWDKEFNRGMKGEV